MGKVKQTFSLEEEVVKRLKILAIEKGKDYSELTEKALIEYIAKNKKTEKTK